MQNSQCQALRYAERSKEKLRLRRKKLRQKLQHLCASLLFKKAEIAYFTECANVREISEYRTVSALKYRKSDNRSKTISVQL